MSIINNAMSGALAAQAALSVTSQNIANLMTPGYTRQGILLSAAGSSGHGAAAVGNGVQTPQLLRFADDYKSQQMWTSATTQGQHSAMQPYLTQLERVMGDETSSINSGMDAFFAALNAASVEPTSSPLRQQVITAAEALTVRFNSQGQVLANQRLAVAQQRDTVLAQINALSGDIARLNDKITSAGALGASPSGLLDERDSKIDALSAMVGLQVTNQPDGSRSISLKNGAPLVVGGTASQIKTPAPLADGSPQLIAGAPALAVTFAKETFHVASRDLGGQLGGLDAYQADVLQPMVTATTDMAAGLASSINTTLGQGFALDGSAGGPLFVMDASSVSAMLTIHPDMNAKDLGFSRFADTSGDSGNLQQLIGLKDMELPVGKLGTVRLGDAYTQLVSRVGGASQQNITALSVADTMRTYAESNWAATSGVNQDEEAISLVQYQQMYQANMQVFATANSLFDATLAILR